MKNQKLLAILKKQFRTVPQRAIIILSAMILGLIFGTMHSIFAQFQPQVSVKVGETQTFRIPRPVTKEGITFKANQPGVVRIRFNKNFTQYQINGLSAGTIRIVFKGTYRGGGGGGLAGGIQGAGTKFTETVTVTVTPQAEAPAADPNTVRVQINRGQNRDIGVDTLLGPEFAKFADNGVRWREVVLKDGDIQIVRGDLVGSNPMKVRVTGVNSGQTKLTLQGQALRNNTWQTVTKTLEIIIAADANPNGEPADPWLEGMERRLETLKNAARQAGRDEFKIDRSIRDIEGFITLVRAEIAKELSRPTPRELRKARLENLRDDANNGLLRLRERWADIAKQIIPIGWHTILSDLKIVLGPKPARRTFSCPVNPNKSYGTVYGTDRYLINSSLCTAAVHKNAINPATGGTIIVEFYGGQDGDKYLGSQRNGVTSLSWERNWGYFIFVR